MMRSIYAAASFSLLSSLLMLAACGGGHGGSAGSGAGSGNGGDPNTNPDDGPPAGNPDGKCPVPTEAQAEDTSQPTTVVGDGTPASCTGDAFVAAVAKGGI